MSAQSRPLFWDLMDCSPSGSFVLGIFQARKLEWVAISSSRGLPDPGTEPVSPASPALEADSLPAEPWGGKEHTSTETKHTSGVRGTHVDIGEHDCRCSVHAFDENI